MYTIEYIVHTYVHYKYTCAYINVYTVKQSGHNNVLYIYVSTCMNMYFYVYYVHTHNCKV